MPPCSHDAERIVHQRPKRNRGTAPLAPNRNRLSMLGDPSEKSPLISMPLGSAARVAR